MSQEGSDDIIASNAGSNGRPKAYLLMKPKRKLSVVILARERAGEGAPGVGSLARELLELLEKGE